MFVKLLNKQNLDIILNINQIISLTISPMSWTTKQENSLKITEIKDADYVVSMTNGDAYIIEKDQYDQLCKILDKLKV